MDTASKLEAHERECSIRYASFEDKLDHIDKRLWRLEALMMASTLTIVAAAVGLFTEMTQLVFALIVTMGTQTISSNTGPPSRRAFGTQELNKQHHHTYHRHHKRNESIHAKCIPVRVDPSRVEIFDHLGDAHVRRNLGWHRSGQVGGRRH